MSDDDVLAGGPALTYDEAFHKYAGLDTLAELDRFREALRLGLPDQGAVNADQWVAKIRAHVVADEFERKRLQGVIMRDGRMPDGTPVFTPETVMRVLELPPDWELAPQQARLAARKMEPNPICGAIAGDPCDVCMRPKGHRGQHCPRERCDVDHDGAG